MLPTDLTVAAVVERDGRFLIVEERAAGAIVITQPGGHIEAAESPEDAVARETLEETGCTVRVNGLLGVYLWIQPQTRQQFLRLVYTADFLAEDRRRSLDDGIHAVHWYTRADLERRSEDVRSPVVLVCIEDYLAGHRQSDQPFSVLAPVQQQVDAMLAHARLV